MTTYTVPVIARLKLDSEQDVIQLSQDGQTVSIPFEEALAFANTLKNWLDGLQPVQEEPEQQ